MKKLFYLIFVFLLFLVMFSLFIFASNLIKLEIKEGKNKIIFNVTEKMAVKDFARLNPQIEAISSLEEEKGFVNILGGLGKLEILKPGEAYEIVTSSNKSLIIMQIEGK